MKKKIKDYVSYEFRNVYKTKEVEEAIEEVTANLFDMYDDLLSKGYSDEDAYIQTVKNLGSFSNEFISFEKEEKYIIKPKWFDLLLVLSTITAVFALVLPFLNIIIGAIILLFSAIFFGISAYFMYQSASFALNEKKDLEYHNYILTKILKFAQINKIFWLISSTYIVSAAIVHLIVQLLTFNAFSNGLQDPSDVLELFQLSVFIFIITFIVNLIIFYVLYQKAYKKYHELTGELTFRSDRSKKQYHQTIILLVLNLLTFLFYLLPIARIIYNGSYISNNYTKNVTGISMIFYLDFPYLIFGIIILGTMIYSIIKHIISLKNKQYQVSILSAIIYFVQVVLLNIVLFSKIIVNVYLFCYLVIFLTIASIIISIINIIIRQRKPLIGKTR